MIVTTYPSAADFLQSSQAILETNEAANSLLLGISFRLKNAPDRMKTRPYFITVSNENDLVLAALMTPPHNLVIYGQEVQPQAMDTFVQQLQVDEAIPPGVLGPSGVAKSFAEVWTKSTGVSYRAGMSQGIYELRQVIPPEQTTPGKLRLVAAEEIDLVTRWALDFQAEALSPGNPLQTRQAMEDRIDHQELYVWEDEQPVCMVAKSRPISNGISVSLVYTPSEFRRRGYAGNAVATLSQILLDEGWQFCSLHTDLTNPTSNHIYQAIGYKRVCDFNEYIFDAQNYEQ
jgi:predicted GNAT family acetyltransferase